MAMTEEQKERARKNRERALEIRRRRMREEAEEKLIREEQLKQERNKFEFTSDVQTHSSAGDTTRNTKTQENMASNTELTKEEKEDESNVQLEDFEIDASPYVTKQDARNVYCLPEGTIAVCSYIEKDNPRQSKWNKMKLYRRSEIRKWARERWGGLDGLVAERRKREMKRFERDLDDVKDIFSTKKRKR